MGATKLYYHPINIGGPVLFIVALRPTAFTFEELFNATTSPSARSDGIVAMSVLGGGSRVLKQDTTNNAIKVFTMRYDGTWSVYYTFSSINSYTVTGL